MFTNRSGFEDAIIEIAEYVYEEKATVRKAAAVFGVSKSTVHKDLTVRLKEIDGELYARVYDVLQQNKLQRHIRGGNATKLKYMQKRLEKMPETKK